MTKFDKVLDKERLYLCDMWQIGHGNFCFTETLIGRNEKGSLKFDGMGRIILFNEHTLYLGYHHLWVRHGIALEIPVTNIECREPFKIRRYNKGQLILPEDETEKNELIQKDKQRTSENLNLFLFNVLKEWDLLAGDSPIAELVTERYHIQNGPEPSGKQVQKLVESLLA